MQTPVESPSIGLFDSGIGGLTVLQQLVRVLPHENFVYFGDTARLPYGEKSRETIIRYSIENSIFLFEKNIKMLVIPCNTATSFALDKLQQIFSIPVIGVIEPGAESAVATTRNGRIAVLGTRGTIQSHSYQKAILKHAPNAFILPIACPLFVPLVEENYVDHPATHLIVEEYLKPIRNQNIDTLLLGCTHYPLLKKLIAKVVGDQLTIIDSATSCAEKVAKILNQLQLKKDHTHPGQIRYYVSDDPQKFQKHGRAFLNLPIDHVELKSTESNR